MRDYLCIILSMFLFVSCETDFDNPNAPQVADVSGNINGLTGLIVGLEFQYTISALSGLYNSVSANGLTTGELQVLNAGNAQLAAILNGGSNIAPSNGVITNLWTNLNLIRSNAQTIIDDSPNAGAQDAQNGIRAFGLFYKALSIGTMAQYWESVTVETGPEQTFVSRAEGLGIAIENLSEAQTLLQSTAVPQSVLSAVGNQIDLENSILALIARYNLMLGNYEEAISAANAVDLSSSSTFIFDNVAQNPVFRSSLITNNVYDVNPDFGLTGELAPDANDGRIDFYLTPNENNGKGFFTADESPIPIYLPGEILLIIAEANARLNRTDEAIQSLNLVLTKTSGDDIFGLGADLPAYSGATDQTSVLTEIYKNRRIELYMTGLSLEDSRRFGRPGPNDTNAERTRDFYPYPNAERDNNPNTPPDPSI